MKKLLKIIDTQIINLEYEGKAGPPYITEEHENEIYDTIDKLWKIRNLIDGSEERVFVVAVPENNKTTICSLYNAADAICFREYDGEYSKGLSEKKIIKTIKKTAFRTIENPYEILGKLEEVVDNIVNADIRIVE